VLDQPSTCDFRYEIGSLDPYLDQFNKRWVKLRRAGEIIADNLSKAGWSWGYVSAIDSNGRKIWIADAHRGDIQRCAKSPSEFWCVSITLPVLS